MKYKWEFDSALLNTIVCIGRCIRNGKKASKVMKWLKDDD